MDKAEYIFEKLAQMVAKPDTTTSVNRLIADKDGNISAQGRRIITQPGGKSDTLNVQTPPIARVDPTQAQRVAGGSTMGPVGSRRAGSRTSDRNVSDNVTADAHKQIRGGFGKIIKDRQ